MIKRPILSAIFAALLFVSSIKILNTEHVKVSFLGSKLEPLNGIMLAHIVRVNPESSGGDALEATSLEDEIMIGKAGEWSYCDYAIPSEPSYDVEFVSSTIDEEIVPGEMFMVSMTFKNTGNVRLFSANSDCTEVPILNLGTQGSQDRESIFGYTSKAISGWTNARRIAMQNDYVEPGEEFQIMFQSMVPEGDNIYREYFQPVVENVAWIGDIFSIDVEVGKPTESMVSNMSFVKDQMSLAASDIESLERNFLIDLSDQKMYIRFGEKSVWSIQISSGASATPTPVGSFPISLKQELRVGGKWPHYRMPYFMMWRSDGYGIHALPYLANDGGSFWTEAREHIGIPVSHGCVRTLPEDAVIIYEFASIGTKVNIQY